MKPTNTRSHGTQATIIELELQELSLEYYAGEISRQEFDIVRHDLVKEIKSL